MAIPGQYHISTRNSLEEINGVIENIIDSYADWEKVRYMQLPNGYSPEYIWELVQSIRKQQQYAHTINICGEKYEWYITPAMQKILHLLDKSASINEYINLQYSQKDKHLAKTNAMVEEVAANAQLAGYAVTKKQVREIILKKQIPRNEMERVIKNIYQSILFVTDKEDIVLDASFIKKIHEFISKDILLPKSQGAFRKNAAVDESTTGSTEKYEPFNAKNISEAISQLCVFYNNKKFFTHPIILAAIAEYFICYLKPFKDGNGRVSRLITLWALFKSGYSIAVYQSASAALLKLKTQYHKAFQQVDTSKDIGYYIHFKLQLLQLALKAATQQLLRPPQQLRNKKSVVIAGLNLRQFAILHWIKENAEKVITIREVRSAYGVSKETARTDLTYLLEKGWLKYYNINKKTYAFVKGGLFDELMQQYG